MGGSQMQAGAKQGCRQMPWPGPRLRVGAVQTGVEAKEPALEGRPPRSESQHCLLLAAVANEYDHLGQVPL